jgi:pimeloyl-ACP methyl ester carboxylesterase
MGRLTTIRRRGIGRDCGCAISSRDPPPHRKMHRMSTPETPPPDIAEAEWLVATPQGRLFAQTWTPTWTPRLPDAGARPRAPILLFHDSLGCVALWRSFPRALAAATRRRVVAYDRLGFGRSDPHPGRLALGFVAAEAEHSVPLLCTELAIADFVPCGHSVGGGMAIETAARFPDRCRALITIAAQAFVEDKTLVGISAAREQFKDPAAVARLARYHGDKARWVIDAWTESWLAPEFASWTVDDALAAVRCPVLAVHGDGDEYGSSVHPARIAAVGRGTAHILPATGHVPHREREALLVAMIDQFLQGAEETR